jgi:hypothetical protein
MWSELGAIRMPPEALPRKRPILGTTAWRIPTRGATRRHRRTDLSNLIHLCGFPHRLVHEGGYTIEKPVRGGVLFRRPDGEAVRNVPSRQPGDPLELQRRHRRAGLRLDHETCAPRVSFDRMHLA